MRSSKDHIKQIKEKFGKPKELKTSFQMNQKEFENLLDSMKDGRSSDITLIIFKDRKVVVIAKPWYKKGIYRLPSGGWKPDESFEDCAQREAYEETGLKIELQKYILRIDVTFTYRENKAYWTSHIFTAKYISGELKPIDKQEIKRVKLLTVEKLLSLKDRLLKQNSGGLAYRAFLTEEAIKEIKENL